MARVAETDQRAAEAGEGSGRGPRSVTDTGRYFQDPRGVIEARYSAKVEGRVQLPAGMPFQNPKSANGNPQFPTPLKH